MVSLASLDYAELGRCLLAALASGAAVWGVSLWMGGRAARHLFVHGRADQRALDLILLLAGTALWLLLSDWILRKSGSALPGVVRKRLGVRTVA